MLFYIFWPHVPGTTNFQQIFLSSMCLIHFSALINFNPENFISILIVHHDYFRFTIGFNILECFILLEFKVGLEKGRGVFDDFIYIYKNI